MRKSTAWFVFGTETLLLSVLFFWPMGKVVSGGFWVDGHFTWRYLLGVFENPIYVETYRFGNAYHGAHPFYMWYWGSHALQHCGKVIIVGGDAPTIRRLGFTPASTFNDALEIASDVVGRSPTITHFHTPPIMIADVK
jgi:hypothetical protein